MLGGLLRWAAYSVYFMAALVGFIYLSIPTGKVKRYVAHQATVKLKKKVTIDDLEVHGISGVTLKGVTLELPVAGPEGLGGGPQAGAPSSQKAPGTPSETDTASDATPPMLVNPPGLIMADSIRVDVNTLGLLTGEKLKAALNAELSGGTMSDVLLTAGAKGWDLEVGDITGVNLAPMRLFRTLFKMDMDVHTRLSGRAKLYWGGAIQNSTADLKFALTDTVVPFLPIKHPKQPFPIGEAFDVQLGNIEFRAKLDKADKLPGLNARARAGAPTTLLLEEFSANGEHIRLQLDAGQKHTISFRGKSAGDATVNIKLVVHFTDEFFAWKGDGMRGDGSVAKDMSHQSLKQGLDSFLKTARVKVGGKYYYGFHCQGPLKSFKCPARAPNRRISAPKAPAKPESAPTARAARPKASKNPAVTGRPKPAKPRASRKLPKPPRARPTRPASRLVEPGNPDSVRDRYSTKPRKRPTRKTARDEEPEELPEEDEEPAGEPEEDEEAVDEEEPEGEEDELEPPIDEELDEPLDEEEDEEFID